MFFIRQAHYVISNQNFAYPDFSPNGLGSAIASIDTLI